MNELLSINPQQEKDRIVMFLKKIFAEQQIENAVIGLSGGIDSTVSFYLLKEVLSPEHIFAAHLYYDSPAFPLFQNVLDSCRIPKENRYFFSVKPSVDETAQLLGAETDHVRTGNIAARMRMIVLFDLAKKHTALVCGTENKSENLLGYFTRFGDQASDIEPIEHLYKTQIYQLAKHLDIPEGIISQSPTAGLWLGQTDEGEFGFTYEEADHVLFLTFEKKMSIEEVEKHDLPNAKKILDWHKRNLFKHNTPYVLK